MNSHMTYFFDKTETHKGMDGVSHNVYYKGRVYRVVDQHKNLRWYEVEQVTYIDGVEAGFSSFSDYQNGAYLEIPQADLDRALTRKSKVMQ